MKRVLLVIFLFLFVFSSCSSKESFQSRQFYVMDTLAEVRIYEAEGDSEKPAVIGKQTAEHLETVISATREESDTYAFNHALRTSFSQDFLELLRLSVSLSELTGGCFDATSGSLIALWKSCEEDKKLPTDSQMKTALDAVGYQKIKLDGDNVSKTEPSLMLDFGAVGKGYAADKMAYAMKENGAVCGMISFISSVTVFGEREFKIGIRQPDTSGNLCGYITLCDESLSVSGDYERFYDIDGVKYPHILDPKTGKPSSLLHSVVVVADSGAIADALSTAIFVMGIDEAAMLYQSGLLDFEFLAITDEEMIASDGFLKQFESRTDSYSLRSLSEYISER